MAGGLPREFDEPTAALRASIALRDFPLGTPRSLVFTFAGGMGDVFVALEAVAGLRRWLKREDPRGRYEMVGLFSPTHRGQFARVLEAFPVLDQVATNTAVRMLRLRHRPLVLDATPWGCRLEGVQLGGYLDLQWAKWGIPSRFQARVRDPLVARFRRVLRAAARTELPAWRPAMRRGYVLLAPDSVYLGGKKSWPVASWSALVREVLRAHDTSVAICTQNAELVSALPRDERVLIHDYRTAPGRNDAFRAAVTVAAAMAVVTVESATGHIAGLLEVPCVTLFGPTSPALFGHRHNVNLRTSVCAPCSGLAKERSCTSNLCMQEIPSGVVSRLTADMLAGHHRPR